MGEDLIGRHPDWLPDKLYLSVIWKMLMGYELDWNNPRTFNEKLQWLKVHDHNPLYTTLVDKYRVKQWVADRIGQEYVIPTLAVFASADDINPDTLPEQFVLKCNHDSGSILICRDKSTFDMDAAKTKLAKGLERNFYREAREWAYKNVPRLVFAEKYMENPLSKDLLTYKFLCFSGEPYIMYVTVKNENVFENYYDMDFEPLDIHRKWPNSQYPIPKPTCWEDMKRVARELSQGLNHVRLDLYEVNGQVYFSEYTFYDWGGLFTFTPDVWDQRLGDKIQLLKK